MSMYVFNHDACCSTAREAVKEAAEMIPTNDAADLVYAR